MRNPFALFPFLAAAQLPAPPGMPAVPPTDEITRTATVAGVIGAVVVLLREFLTWRRQMDGPPRGTWREPDSGNPPPRPLRLEIQSSDALAREPSRFDDHRSD